MSRRPIAVTWAGPLGATVASVLLVACGAGDPDGTTGTSGQHGAQQWERLPVAPLSGRGRAVVGVVGQTVVVAGGQEFLCPPMADCLGPEQVLRDGAALDLGTRTWRPISDAPVPLESGERSVTAAGSSLFVLGSCDSDDCEAPPVLLEYDLDADRWSEHPLPVSNRSPYAALVTVGDRVLVAPVSDEHGEEPDLWFHPDSETWSRLPDDPLPQVFDRFALVLPDGDVVIAGSPEAQLDGGGEVTTKLFARLDAGTGRWEQLSDAPGPGYQVWPAGTRFLMNGHFGDSASWFLDPKTQHWSAASGDLDRDHGVDLYGVVGESTASFDTPNGVGSVAGDGGARVWDLRAHRYLTLPAPPRVGEVYDDSSAAVGNGLLTFGGQAWTGRDGRLLNDAWLWTPPEA